MSNRDKVLLIVEGKTEVTIFEQISKVIDLPFDIVPYRNNIHVLYQRLKRDGFNVDIKALLLERATPKEKAILSQNFAFIYLIYDCDPHHSTPNIKDDNIHAICQANMENLHEMLKHFIDEGDTGKLFINYPMIESIRDANDFFDNDYAEAKLIIDGKRAFKTYKQITGKKALAHQRIDCWTRENIYNLIRQNLFKLNSVCHDCWEMPSYDTFRDMMDKHEAFKAEQKACIEQHFLYVLNTSILILLDYLGKSFYDKLNAPTA